MPLFFQPMSYILNNIIYINDLHNHQQFFNYCRTGIFWKRQIFVIFNCSDFENWVSFGISQCISKLIPIIAFVISVMHIFESFIFYTQMVVYLLVLHSQKHTRHELT